MAEITKPTDPREVVATNPIDLSPYQLRGSKVLLEIPIEAGSSRKILYSKLRQDVFYKVLQLGSDMHDRGIEVGDYVLMNPDLPPNQIPVVSIDNHKMLILEFHEIFFVRNKKFIPTEGSEGLVSHTS